MSKKSAYASAGVDLAVSNRLKDDLPALLASTQRSEVLGEVGGFGGLFALNTRNLLGGGGRNAHHSVTTIAIAGVAVIVKHCYEICK